MSKLVDTNELEQPKANPFEGGAYGWACTASMDKRDVSIMIDWWSNNRNLTECKFSGPVEAALEVGSATRTTLLEIERTRTAHLNKQGTMIEEEKQALRLWRVRNPLQVTDEGESYDELK